MANGGILSHLTTFGANCCFSNVILPGTKFSSSCSSSISFWAAGLTSMLWPLGCGWGAGGGADLLGVAIVLAVGAGEFGGEGECKSVLLCSDRGLKRLGEAKLYFVINRI